MALREIGLKTMIADPHVWIRAYMRPYGYDYYGIRLVYVDDIMIVSHLDDEVAKQIGDFYKIKEGIQGPPTRYLGADTEKILTDDGCDIWKTSSMSNITNAVETFEGVLLEDGK